MAVAGDPFELFCLYYLGLTPQGEYRFANANKIAAQLNWSVGELMQALRSHGLHPDTVLNTDFPLARYQVDFQIAAQEASVERLKALAQSIYRDFRGTSKPRDWHAEIAQEQQEDLKGGHN